MENDHTYTCPPGLARGVWYFPGKGDGKRNIFSDENVSLGGTFGLLEKLKVHENLGSEFGWRRHNQYKRGEPEDHHYFEGLGPKLGAKETARLTTTRQEVWL